MRNNILIRLMRLLFKRVKGCTVLQIVYCLKSILWPILTMIVLQNLFKNLNLYSKTGERWFIYTGVLYYLLLIAFDKLLEIYLEKIITISQEKFQMALLEEINEHTLQLQIDLFENSEIHNKRLRAIECVNNDYLNYIINDLFWIPSSGLAIISIFIAVSFYSPLLVIISIITVIPSFFVRWLRFKNYYSMRRNQSSKRRRFHYLFSLFINSQSVKEMRVLGYGGYIYDKWSKIKNEIHNEEHNQKFKSSLFSFMCDVFKALGYGMGIVCIAFLLIAKKIIVGEFAACLTAFNSLQDNVDIFLENMAEYKNDKLYVKDYFEYLDIPCKETGNLKYNGIKRGIRFSDISYRYPQADVNAVSNINLELNKGETIAVIGHNGSGKSTLIKLLLGLCKPTEGEILYDEINLSEYNVENVYNVVTSVFQEICQYYFSLRENIAIGDISKLEYTEKLLDALKLSDGIELISKIGGIDEGLGREFGGAELSGGEWQKIANARGILRKENADLVIFDEPTSSLDPLAEDSFLKLILELCQNKTALIVSHRVWMGKFVDKIVVMEKGSIKEIGTHDELIKLRGVYNELYTAQEESYTKFEQINY